MKYTLFANKTVYRATQALAMIMILASCAILCPRSVLGRVTFERTYGTDTLDAAWSVKQTTDGGYVVSGYTFFTAGPDPDLYLVRTDSVGDTVWSRTYGGSSWDEAMCVQQTSDGGYIVTGYTISFGAGKKDVYLVKTDSSGDALWTHTYGDTGDNTGFSVQQTDDGGYVIAGQTGYADAYLIKTDSLGGLLWERTYGGIEGDWAASVDATVDGGYIVAGGAQSFGAGGEDIWVIKTDSIGNVLWDMT